MRVTLELSSGPATEPMTVADAKAFLRIDSSDDDAVLTSLIKTARRYVENYTGRALITQTWIQWMDRFPGGSSRGAWWNGVKEGPVSLLSSGGPSDSIALLRAPVSSITSISTFNVDDTETTFASSEYIADLVGDDPRVYLRDGATWPVDLRRSKAVKIIFVAGYGSGGGSIPDDILTAMKQLIAHWYENREAASENALTEVPLSARVLLCPYQVPRL